MNDIGESSKKYLTRAFGELVDSIKSDAWDVAVGIIGVVTAIVCIVLLPAALVYFKFLKGHSNCLLWAVEQRVKYAWRRRKWAAVRIIAVKNSRGRLHFQVRVADTGNVYEWYAKGASSRSRLENLWYKGEMKKVNK